MSNLIGWLSSLLGKPELEPEPFSEYGAAERLYQEQQAAKRAAEQNKGKGK